MAKSTLNLKSAFAGIKEAQAAAATPAPTQTELEGALTLSPPPAPAAAPVKAWTRGKGKSSNPAYERMTVYVPSETRKKAERKWEDAGGGDLSDLVEDLLTRFVNT